MVSPCRGKTHDECEQIRIIQIRQELRVTESILANVSDTKINKKYRTEAKKYISAIRFYISHHKSWPPAFQGCNRPSVCEVWDMMQKGLPVVLCAEQLAKSAGMDSAQRTAKDRLLYNLRRPTTWVPKSDKIEGSDTKGDPANKHPANIRYMAEQKERARLARRNELHALKPKKTKEELERLGKERRKLTLKQRKASKAKFARLEKERGSKKERGIKIGV